MIFYYTSFINAKKNSSNKFFFAARALGWKDRKDGEIVKLPPVQLLRLDYNKFGSAGVERLSQGLAQNNTLRGLWLQYCSIGPEGGQHLANILMYRDSEMDQLLLRGNELRDVGMTALLKGVKRNQKLRILDVADNKFTECNEVLDLLLELFANNQSNLLSPFVNFDLYQNKYRS